MSKSWRNSRPPRSSDMKDDLTLLGSCTLDHDGCVVCSDTGIPVRVLSIDGDDALCEDSAGNQTEIAVELVAPVTQGVILLTPDRARAEMLPTEGRPK
jgi:hypothetical protein